VTKAYEDLTALRSTSAEEQLQQLQKLSNTRLEKSQAVSNAYKTEVDRLTELVALPAEERDVLSRLKAKEDECEVLRSELEAAKIARKEKEGKRLQEINAQLVEKDKQSA
jgi:glutamine synthetase